MCRPAQALPPNDIGRRGRRARRLVRLACLLATLPTATPAAPEQPAETVATTWIGNTGGASPASAFPGSITDLWVDRDGTAYLTSPRDAGGRSLAVYREGQCLGRYAGLGGLVIAGNRDRVFVGVPDGVRILPKSPAADQPAEWIDIENGDGTAEGGVVPDGIATRGLHATDRHLYVSNAARQRVEQWDLQSRRKLQEWPFARPGAITADPHGGLWVARERLLAPDIDARTRNWRELRPADVREAAAVVRIDSRNGTVLETLEGPDVPVALAVHPRLADGHPALLVADNGLRQQILVYSRREARRSTPRKPLGNLHGFLGPAGQAPTDRRFNGFTGLGVTADGSLFVAQNWNVLCERRADYPAQCAELLEFTPSLDRLARSSQRLVGGQPATVDPRPPFDVHVRNVRFAMAWERPAGQEWSLAGRTTDPIGLPHDPAFLARLDHPAVRQVLGQEMLFGTEKGTLLVFRRDRARHGEVWIPTGALCPEDAPIGDSDEDHGTGHPSSPRAWTSSHGTVRRGLADERDASLAREGRFGWLWTDGRGADPMDGRLQLDETESLGTAWRDPVWSVDALGGIWMLARETVRGRPAAASFTAWFAERPDVTGIPLYRRQPPRAVPPPFAGGTVLWHRYEPGSDRLLIAGRTPQLQGGGIRLVGTYAGWSNAGAVGSQAGLNQLVLLPHSCDGPPSDDDAADGTEDVMDLDVAGDLLVALQPAPLRVGVYSLTRGNRIATLRPEGADGAAKPTVAHAGVRAFAREDGELVVLLPDVAGDRLALLRWRPPDHAETAPTVAPALEGRILARRVRLFWSTPDSGAVEGYHVYRSSDPDETATRLTEKPLTSAFFEDAEIAPGHAYDYRVSIVNAVGEGPASKPLRLVPAEPTARFVGEDRTTLGNWKGRYGSWGYHLFGEAQSPEAANPRYPSWLGGVGRKPCKRARAMQPDLRLDPALPQRAAEGRADERVAGVLPGSDSEPGIVPVEIRDGRSVRASVYCGSSEQIHGVRVEVVDTESGQVLDAREFCNEEETSSRGRYLTWDVTGNVLLRITAPRATGRPDLCGINAVFFDPATALAPAARTTGQPVSAPSTRAP